MMELKTTKRRGFHHGNSLCKLQNKHARDPTASKHQVHERTPLTLVGNSENEEEMNWKLADGRYTTITTPHDRSHTRKKERNSHTWPRKEMVGVQSEEKDVHARLGKKKNMTYT